VEASAWLEVTRTRANDAFLFNVDAHATPNEWDIAQLDISEDSFSAHLPRESLRILARRALEADVRVHRGSTRLSESLPVLPSSAPAPKFRWRNTV
jgi:hypothetical protein